MKLLALALVTALLLPAAPPLPIEWHMTTAAFAGRRAIVTLDTGARVQGSWLGVSPDTFTMDIERSRGKNRPPLGVQTLQRNSIVDLRLQEKRIRGRAWGAALGYFIGAPLAINTGSAAAALPVFAAVLTFAFLAGRASDKATRPVHITPDSPPPPE